MIRRHDAGRSPRPARAQLRPMLECLEGRKLLTATGRDLSTPAPDPAVVTNTTGGDGSTVPPKAINVGIIASSASQGAGPITPAPPGDAGPATGGDRLSDSSGHLLKTSNPVDAGSQFRNAPPVDPGSQLRTAPPVDPGSQLRTTPPVDAGSQLRTSPPAADPTGARGQQPPADIQAEAIKIEFSAINELMRTGWYAAAVSLMRSIEAEVFQDVEIPQIDRAIIVSQTATMDGLIVADQFALVDSMMIRVETLILRDV